MNKNIDLTNILKDCPEGMVFWSDNYGEVQFYSIREGFDKPILTKRADESVASYTKEGWCSIEFPANCLLWPSKDCRDWAKFSAPWYKKEKFDPKTLKPFDKVLGRNVSTDKWGCTLFSNINVDAAHKFHCVGSYYKCCIPYNDDTKHLVGTTDEAPEYYIYWEE